MEKDTVIKCIQNTSDCQWAIDILNKCNATANMNDQRYAYN